MGEDFGADKKESSFLPMYSGIGSSVGRLVFGQIADLQCCIRLYLCQTALLCISLASFLVSLGNSYSALVIYAFSQGLFEGCYVMVNPVVTSELVGKEKLSYALGASYLLMFVPRSLGPPIAGWIFDASESYDVAFYYTGAVTLLSCCMMFIVPCFEPRMRMNNKQKLSEVDRENKLVVSHETHQANIYESTVWCRETPQNCLYGDGSIFGNVSGAPWMKDQDLFIISHIKPRSITLTSDNHVLWWWIKHI